MSSIVDEIPSSSPPPGLAPDAGAAAAAGPADAIALATSNLRWLGRNVWALADQVLISGTNFVTAALTLRALANRTGEFGTFTNIYVLLLLANILQSTLITQAHNVIGATLAGAAYRRYTTSAAVAQLFIVAFEALLVVPLMLWSYARGWNAAPMLLALIPSIVFWQLQEFIRRILYTEGRVGAAFINDIISYGGQAAIIIGLFAAQHFRGYVFTGEAALYALAGTSAAGALLGAWQIRRSLAKTVSAHDIRENWHFGKWLAGGELMAWCYSLPMQMWWAGLLIGTVASANLRAAQILFGPTRVVAFFLGTVLPIRFARSLHARGRAALSHEVKSVYVVLVPIVGLYCLLLALFPTPLLHLVYGRDYAAGQAATILMLYSICQFLNYLQMVITAALTAARQTRYIFIGCVFGCVIALMMSPICIKTIGANGAIVSLIVTTVVVTLLFVHAYLKNLHMPAVAAVESLPGTTTEEPA